MFVSHLKVRNWRNFPIIDVDFQKRLFIIGPNASGKSKTYINDHPIKQSELLNITKKLTF